MTLLALNLLFIASVVIALLATHRVQALARAIGALDIPDERKIHTRETPRLGGLSIVLGFALPLLALLLIPGTSELVLKNIRYLLGVLVSGTIILGLGIYDDLIGANAPKKFFFQTLAALVLIAFDFGFREISIAGVQLELGWFGPVLTVLWIVAIINAINFVDGMDSLASFVALTITLSFIAISALRGDIFTLILMTALAGALVGFIPWNLPPARIFMGDTGSMFIGLLLATVAIVRNAKSPATIAIAGPILALSLPILDMLFVMRGRFFRPGLKLAGRIFAMFNADREHFHHLLYRRYGSHGRTVALIWLLTVLFSVSAVLTIPDQTKIWGYRLAGLALVLTVVTRSLVSRLPEIRSEIDELEELTESWEQSD